MGVQGVPRCRKAPGGTGRATPTVEELVTKPGGPRCGRTGERRQQGLQGLGTRLCALQGRRGGLGDLLESTGGWVSSAALRDVWRCPAASAGSPRVEAVSSPRPRPASALEPAARPTPPTSLRRCEGPDSSSAGETIPPARASRGPPEGGPPGTGQQRPHSSSCPAESSQDDLWVPTSRPPTRWRCGPSTEGLRTFREALVKQDLDPLPRTPDPQARGLARGALHTCARLLGTSAASAVHLASESLHAAWPCTGDVTVPPWLDSPGHIRNAVSGLPLASCLGAPEAGEAPLGLTGAGTGRASEGGSLCPVGTSPRCTRLPQLQSS